MGTKDDHNKETQRPSNQDEPDFHGAAVINDDGEEVPITEEMVDEALKSLDEPNPSNNQ